MPAAREDAPIAPLGNRFIASRFASCLLRPPERITRVRNSLRRAWKRLPFHLFPLSLLLAAGGLSLPLLHSRIGMTLPLRSHQNYDLLMMIWIGPLYVAYQQMRMRRLKSRMRRRDELFRLISEHAADMIALVDVSGKRLYNSPAYQKVLGYTPKELSATSAFEQIHPDDREKVIQAAKEARECGSGKTLEYRIRHKDGNWRVLESTASVIRNRLGQAEKLVIVNRDITERKRAEEQLAHNALHDALTHLPNRTLFLDRLQHAFEMQRRNPEFKFAVLFADIDGFKIFNDTMGHMVGDLLLVEIGRRLANCLRLEDTVARPLNEGPEKEMRGNEVLARLGGDEFTILVGSIQEPSDAMRVARRIQEALQPPFTIQGREVFTSASIGIALSTTPHEKAEELLRDADIAMYRAKTLGRSRSEFFDQDMHAKAVNRLNLETDLRRALEEEEFRIHYQPIVLLSTGRVAGFEALVRWQRSPGTMIFPDDFIGAAEATGIVVPLGKWVLRGACRQLRTWQSQYPGSAPLSVTVNVSPKQFADPDLVSDIEKALRESGIDPGSLHLEITENLVMTDPARTVTVLSQLKKMGISISIDDFGTGHSSLSRLRGIPVDVLKIDRSFIANIDTDPEAREVVRLIVELAHLVNLQVVAEGVENAIQRNVLSNLGCEFAQGYFFSRPVAHEEAARLIAAYSSLPLVNSQAAAAGVD
jgi:PAS domain S-box-containing protein